MKPPEHIDIEVTIGSSKEIIRYQRVPGRIIPAPQPSGKYSVPRQTIPSTIKPRKKRRGILGWLDRIEGIG